MMDKKMTDPYPRTWFELYNEEKQKNAVLEMDLALALKTTRTLQAGISWFNVDKENDIMDMLYNKYSQLMEGIKKNE